ncbi:MAG: glycosyltransferase family 4 protein [Gemmatimonadota bacterium]|nr:glycosyltransferase family 4 protein [Gemmatimonadota bacterium]
MSDGRGAVVALLPWGDVIEDFLDPIGVSWDEFCAEMTGGWLFGYVEALRTAGVRSVIVCLSERTAAPARTVHAPTGAAVYLLPASGWYRGLRSAIGRGLTWTSDPEHPGRRVAGRLLGAVRNLVPYLATPAGPLADVLRREGCDAVLCQEYEYPRFDACVRLGRRLRIPVFATFQGGDWQVSGVERFVRPWALRRSAGLIVGSRREELRLRERYGMPSNKITRVFNPLDLSLWRAEDRAEARRALAIPPHARVAVWHGRIEMHRKGLDVLIDAWERVEREAAGADVRLLLLGTGSDSGRLRGLLAERRLSGVRWLDEYVLDRGVARRWLSAADVYAFSSRHEGFPVAPLEAMACGLPVVAADAPGVEDILEGGDTSGGVVVPRGDAVALATELNRLLRDSAFARELGARARRRVEERFSLGTVGAQLRRVLVGAGAQG